MKAAHICGKSLIGCTRNILNLEAHTTVDAHIELNAKFETFIKL